MLATASGSGDPTPHDGAAALLEMFSANGIEVRSGTFGMPEYPNHADGIVLLVGRL